MRKVKFIFAILAMAIFTHPNRWAWELQRIKEAYRLNEK